MANTTISSLPNGVTLTGAEYVPMDQTSGGATTTIKVTAAAIAALAGGVPSTATIGGHDLLWLESTVEEQWPQPVGQTGPTGSAGATGAQGPMGPAVFLEADSVDPDLSFVPGPQGAQGSIGNTGATGPQGPIGVPGYDGDQGEDGMVIPGPAGPAGVTGGTGAQGPAGPAVFLEAESVDPDLAFVPGPQGLQGSAGTAGPQGPAGPAVFLEAESVDPDLSFVPGPQGLQGLQGTAGSSGAQGPAGPAVFLEAESVDPDLSFVPGPQGLQGPQGSAGTQGALGPGEMLWLEGTDSEPIMVGPPGMGDPSILRPFTVYGYSGNSLYNVATFVGINGASVAIMDTGTGIIISAASLPAVLNAAGTGGWNLQCSSATVMSVTNGGQVVINLPTAGTTSSFTVAGALDSVYAGTFIGSVNSGVSLGVLIRAGTTTADFALAVQNTSSSNMFVINGNGNATFNPPVSGIGLAVNGPNASTGAALRLTGNFSGAGATNLLYMVDTANTNGVNLQMQTGVGSKFLRTFGTTFQILNNAYTVVVMNLDDSGNVIFTGTNKAASFFAGSVPVSPYQADGLYLEMVPEDQYPPGVPSDLSVNNLVVANNATLNGPVVITNSVTSTLSVSGPTNGRVQIGTPNASGNATLFLNAGTGGGSNIINTSAAALLIQANGTTGITMGTTAGVQIGTPTGGDKGANSLNVTNLYQAGNPVYSGAPVNSFSTSNPTMTLANANQGWLTATSSLTITIPANASVAFPIGTMLTFVNGSATTLSIAITTDTLALANSALTGTRTLAVNGVATAYKVTTTNWIISGAGVS